MKKVKTILLSLLTVSLMIGAFSRIEFQSNAADEPWIFDTTTDTLYVYDDIIVTMDGNGEYIAPYHQYKNDIQTVVLEESVDKISYAFYGYDFDRIIIKNKDINIRTGLAGTTVSIIEFTEDVSSNILVEYFLDEDLTDYNNALTNGGFGTNVVNKYFDQYQGPKPITVTNLGTNSNELNDVYDDMPVKGNNRDWYIWGDNDAVMFPNQSMATAFSLVFSFFESNNNTRGDFFCSGFGYDLPVVYGMEVSLPKTEYFIGTQINPDDFRINVLGLGNNWSGDDGSYWNYAIQDWVWLKNNSIPRNAYDYDDIFSNNSEFLKYNDIWILTNGMYELKDSSYEYNSHLGAARCFIGLDIEGVIYYTYNGADWIETTYTDRWDAYNNDSDGLYSNDRGEYLPIVVLDSRYYQFGSTFCSEYLFEENNKLYNASYDMDDYKVDINEESYIISGDIYYNIENSYVLDDSCYMYTAGDGSTQEKYFLGKYVDDKIYYTYNGTDWMETMYEDEWSARWNNDDELYSNDRGEYLPILVIGRDENTYVIDGNYCVKDSNNYFTSYFYEKNGFWYEGNPLSPAEEYPEFDTSLYLTSTNLCNSIYDESTDRYYSDGVMIGYYDLVKIEQDTLYLYNVDSGDWETTSFSSVEDYEDSMNKSARDITGYYYLDNAFFGGYYYFENNIWYYHNLQTGDESIVQEVYTNVNYLPLEYDYLTDIHNQSSQSVMACSDVPMMMSIGNEPITVVEGDNVISLDYFGLKATVTITGIVDPTTPPTTPTPEPTPTPTPTPPSTTEDATPSAGIEEIPTVVYEEPKEDSEKEEYVPEDTVTNRYKVTFMVDGVKYHEVFVKEGQACILPNNPNKDGFKFEKWDKDLTKVNKNITVSAVFSKISTSEDHLPDTVVDITINIPEQINMNFGKILFFFLLLFLIFLLVLLLLKRNHIPFTYELHKDLREMIITGYTGKDKSVYIEEKYRPFLRKYKVVKIAENAFNGLDENGQKNFNWEIEKIHIPRTVKKIDSKAFINCPNIKVINILNERCEIAEDSFEEKVKINIKQIHL